jgi:hypothetical protein
MLHLQGNNVFVNARLTSMLQQKLLQSLAGEGEQRPEDEIDGCGRAFDVQEDGLNRVSAGRHRQR